MSIGRDLAVGLSFANLCYLRVWSEILTYKKSDTFWMKTGPTPADYAAAMLNVLIVGALVGVGLRAARTRLSENLKRPARWLFLSSLLVPLNALRSVLSNQFPYLKSPLLLALGERGVLLLGLGLAAVGALAIFLLEHRLARLAAAVLLAFSPFVLVTFGQALWKSVQYDPSPYADKKLAARHPLKATASPRILWVVFDELDYQLAFVDRAPGLRLPELDRLRGETLFATDAFPPGPGTPESMPGYFTGRLVHKVRTAGPDQLLLTYKDSESPVPWRTQRTIFSDAYEAGVNTALLGWYHPYCRVLNDSLTECAWWEMAMQHNSMGYTVLQKLPGQTQSLFETTLFSAFGQSLATKQQARTFREMSERAKRAAVDPGLGLTLIHLPIPHAPHSYDRSSGRFTLKNSPIRGYIDSLALTDVSLGELRRTMERARLWDNTTVLVTSDHPYREAALLAGRNDPRIPFMLKLAGESAGFRYDPSFNTVLAHDLLLGVLRRELATVEDVAAWLDRNRSRYPGHY